MSKTKRITQPSRTNVHQAYETVRANYAEVQRRIAAIMVRNAAEAARGELSWGRIGTETVAVEELAQVLALLGDRSAVDELGLKY